MFTKHNLPCVSSVLHQRVNINYERSAGKESKSPLNVDPAKSSILILLQIYLLHCAFVARKKKIQLPPTPAAAWEFHSIWEAEAPIQDSGLWQRNKFPRHSNMKPFIKIEKKDASWGKRENTRIEWVWASLPETRKLASLQLVCMGSWWH